MKNQIYVDIVKNKDIQSGQIYLKSIIGKEMIGSIYVVNVILSMMEKIIKTLGDINKYCDVIRKRYENFVQNKKGTANG
jgi:hypothetical protein